MCFRTCRDCEPKSELAAGKPGVRHDPQPRTRATTSFSAVSADTSLPAPSTMRATGTCPAWRKTLRVASSKEKSVPRLGTFESVWHRDDGALDHLGMLKHGLLQCP
eukprot:scaffold140_cov247-Pinguiococcus_pyrenoidosus.AAC.26